MSDILPIPVDELEGLCRDRAATYALIARLYASEVDQELLEGLQAVPYPQGTGSDDLDLGYRKLATYLSNASDGALTELAIDYVRTFIGHRNDTYGAAYPFESVYTSEKRLLMQEARNEVVAIYRKSGMAVAEAWADPEDHVAIELEYMQFMATKAANLLSQGEASKALACLESQRDFLVDRLIMWTPMLTSDIKRFAKTGLYEGLAYITDGFLQLDREFLSGVFS